MKTPESLETLVDYGIIREVVRPLMSGKEAQVFVVIVEGVECVAKVYKEANNRTFKHRSEYTEGRKTRNSRDQRAVAKRTRHGKKQDEAAWRNAEVDTLYRVRNGGVTVPEPINFVDGVLVMELVKDASGEAAPRLGDLDFEAAEAFGIYKKLIREVVRMLCAGTIHGDLSEFNVLMGATGPVVIDFPQSIDPAKNTSARKLLLRDVENLHRFLSRHAPNQPIKPLGEEMWALYEKNRLSPNTELLGDYVAPTGDTDVSEVLALIGEANEDELMRRDARGDDTPLVAPAPLRRVVDFTAPAKAKSPSKTRSRDSERSRGEKGRAPAKSGDSSRGPAKSRAPSRPNRGDSAATASPGSARREPPKGPAGTASSINSEGAVRPRRRSRTRRGSPSESTTADPNRAPRRESPEPPTGPAGMRGKDPRSDVKRNGSGNPGEDRSPPPKRRRRRRSPGADASAPQKPGSASGRAQDASGPKTASPSRSRESKPAEPGSPPQKRSRRRRRPRAPESR
jgi:RIO kinase 1